MNLGDQAAMAIDERLELEAPPGVEVARVRDRAGFRDFVEVSKLAYLEAGLPAGIADLLLSNADAALASSVIAVARLGGRPVAAALAITNAVTGIGGIYWVGTAPEARRRGAADAVTRFVTNASFDDGATIVTLQASALGEPVYRKMGYREVGRYVRFLSPKKG
jgi:ribosomal protein S18 acetylase RimI-like enzyme